MNTDIDLGPVDGQRNPLANPNEAGRQLVRDHGEGMHDEAIDGCRACEALQAPVQPITDTTSAEEAIRRLTVERETDALRKRWDDAR